MPKNGNAVAIRQEAQITAMPRPDGSVRHDAGAVMEQVIVKGDLSLLAPEERAQYYMAVCQSVGLNPLTRPFLYVKFADGGLQLYPRKEAADQLRAIHKIQTRIIDQKVQEGIYLVVVEARHPDGRVETDIGAVPVAGLQALFLANAMKKAITQGKRRATLAMLGLSLIDDDEIRAIKGARFVEGDPETGEIIDTQPAPGFDVPTATLAQEIVGQAEAFHKAASANVARVEAMKALNAAVRKAFGDIDDAKATRDDIVCCRYGLDAIKDATPTQLQDTAEAVASWSERFAPVALTWLQTISQATTPTMVADIKAVIAEEGFEDAFLLAALAVREEMYPIPGDVFEASGKVIDASLAP